MKDDDALRKWWYLHKNSWETHNKNTTWIHKRTGNTIIWDSQQVSFPFSPSPLHSSSCSLLVGWVGGGALSREHRENPYIFLFATTSTTLEMESTKTHSQFCLLPLQYAHEDRKKAEQYNRYAKKNREREMKRYQEIKHNENKLLACLCSSYCSVIL